MAAFSSRKLHKILLCYSVVGQELQTQVFVLSVVVSQRKLGGAVPSWLVRSSPDRAVRVRALAGDIVLCSWARHFTLRVPLSTQVYKLVPANLMLAWPCDGLASHPGRSRNTPSRFMLQKPEISAALMSHLARRETLPQLNIFPKCCGLDYFWHELNINKTVEIGGKIAPLSIFQNRALTKSIYLLFANL